jgi:hypothetical protein
LRGSSWPETVTEDHQHGGTFSSLNHGVSTESGILVRAASANIFDVGVDGNDRCAFLSQLFCEQSQEPSSVPTFQHLRLADEGIDGARSGRECGKMGLRPAMYVVVLRVGKRLSLKVHYAHDHSGVLQVLFEQRELLVWIPPPTQDLRGLKPTAQ